MHNNEHNNGYNNNRHTNLHSNLHSNNTNNNKFYFNLNSSMPYYIQILTYNLDNFKKNNTKGISRDEVEELLGNEINQLLTDKNKFCILNKWKYGRPFKLTEQAHENGNILFGTNTSWLQSFIIGLLMYAFH
jgi:hypothetical protein